MLFHISHHEIKRQFFCKILLFQHFKSIFMFNLNYFSKKSVAFCIKNDVLR